MMENNFHTKTCRKCGKEHNRNHYWCADCHAENMREWRKTHPLNALQKKKDIARSYAGVYKRKGLLKEEPCEQCGVKAEMHHPDYDQPTLIQWLCRRHHLALHKVTA